MRQINKFMQTKNCESDALLILCTGNMRHDLIKKVFRTEIKFQNYDKFPDWYVSSSPRDANLTCLNTNIVIYVDKKYCLDCARYYGNKILMNKANQVDFNSKVTHTTIFWNGYGNEVGKLLRNIHVPIQLFALWRFIPILLSNLTCRLSIGFNAGRDYCSHVQMLGSICKLVHANV